MKLPETFARMPVAFDAERLRQEALAFTENEWRPHPSQFDGNSALLLVSVNGGQNDNFSIAGQMRPTPALLRSPYLRQVISSIGLPVSRSRLMRIDPGQTCPSHADVNFHWFRRVRIHVPIVTAPTVRFYCGPDSVHMGCGEAWVFDNFEVHSVNNASERELIHLVVDVPGELFLEKYWSLCFPISRRAEWTNAASFRLVHFRFSVDAEVVCESGDLELLSPAEIEALRSDFATIESAVPSSEAFAALMSTFDEFLADWRRVYAETAHIRENLPAFATLIRKWSVETMRVVRTHHIQFDLRNKSLATDAFSVIRTMTSVTNEAQVHRNRRTTN